MLMRTISVHAYRVVGILLIAGATDGLKTLGLAHGARAHTIMQMSNNFGGGDATRDPATPYVEHADSTANQPGTYAEYLARNGGAGTVPEQAAVDADFTFESWTPAVRPATAPATRASHEGHGAVQPEPPLGLFATASIVPASCEELETAWGRVFARNVEMYKEDLFAAAQLGYKQIHALPAAPWTPPPVQVHHVRPEATGMGPVCPFANALPVHARDRQGRLPLVFETTAPLMSASECEQIIREARARTAREGSGTGFSYDVTTRSHAAADLPRCEPLS